MVKQEKLKSQLNNILNEDDEILDLELSYSKISDFDRNGPISLIRKSKVDNVGIKLGSIVDELLFNDKDTFKKSYYIFDEESPTGTLNTLTNIILNNYNDIPSKEEILNIISSNNLWNNVKKKEILLSYFDKESFWNYLDCKFKSINKIIITTEEYNKALELVSILKTHDYSKNILNDINSEYYYQVKFKILILNTYIKGIIDIVKINHIDKTIEFIDLKTGSNSSLEFRDSFIKWRYYIQASLYQKSFKEICKELKLENYKLLPFKFLYISSKEKVPLVYEFTPKWEEASFIGFKYNNVYYKGINELILNIKWCWNNNQFTIPKEIIENNGLIKLNDSDIIVYGS